MKPFFSELKLGFARGLGIGLGILSLASVTVLLAQTLSSFKAGELISASQINSNFSNLSAEITEAVPDETVLAFNLTACPTGWVAADGDNSTPDMRGMFLRGLNDFGSAAGSRADGNQDPSGAGRTLGDYQADAFASHTHSYIAVDHGFIPPGSPNSWARGLDTGPHHTYTSGASGGNETRSQNVSVIFCVRRNN